MAPAGDGAGDLVSRARRHAALLGERTAFVYLEQGERPGPWLSFAALDRRARAVGRELTELGAQGGRAMLLYHAGVEFITALLGCLYAGVVAVPAPPVERLRAGRDLPRLRAIGADAGPALCLYAGDELPAPEEALPGVRRLRTDTLEDDGGWTPAPARPDQLAYLQYTSGSTAEPRGVMIAHAHLAAHLAALAGRWEHDADSCSVTWMPHFHDYGLVEGLLLPLWTGSRAYILSPSAFLRRPARWLEAISRFGATRSAAPTFAYEYCARWVGPGQRGGLDLSRWTGATVGAEAVRPAALDHFAESFAPAGFRREAFHPGYGLAEATLVVTMRPPDRPLASVDLDLAALERGRAVAAADGPRRRLVSSGQPLGGSAVQIVAPATGRAVGPGEVGEIWVAGPSVAAGYWGRPVESAATFAARTIDGAGPYLRTGDLGVIHEGELFVVGRRKELIVVRGRNIAPQDVEESVRAAHPMLANAGCAAFGVEADGEERLALVVEVAATSALAELRDAVRAAVAAAHDLELGRLAFVRGPLPKTSSGKLQRGRCRELLERGELQPLADWGREMAGGAQMGEGAGGPVAGWLRAQVARRLGVEAGAVDPEAPLHGLGLSSLDSVELLAGLERQVGRQLDPTLLYSYPTISALAGYLSGAPGAEPVLEAAAPRQAGEPIAIVGMACRLPGAGSPAELWGLLCAGVDATGAPPADRIRGVDAPAHRGGFLTAIDRFDARHFGIAAREVLMVDPQQRLCLELAWEALEHAGIAPDSLHGSRTGVFIGAGASGYASLLRAAGFLDDPYASLGNAASVVANRISYALDLSGPSLVVDTACSSSLVSVHLACRSLRSRESDLALAGGVNLLLAPEVSASLARAGMLAPDGRSKPFSAAADGYGRGEGCAVLVLRRLADALRLGDTVFGVIRGSAMNQDGRSNGLSAPNGRAQEAVIAEACADAGIDPAQLGYVEAHGTGTPLGDPVEFAALAAVVGRGQADGRACLVGSIKSNIGHLEAAAGVAGLLKAVLALRHGSVPASLHAEQLNPRLSLAGSGLQIAVAHTPWPAERPRRLAGVSSFGFGGTNCHVVVEGVAEPAPLRPDEREPVPQLLLLSAWDDEQLRASAARLAADLGAGPERSLAEICYTAAVGRARLPQRLALLASSHSELAGLLASPEEWGRRAPLVGRAARDEPVVFAFTGQGAQYAGMGRGLYVAQPVFRDAIDRCAELLQPTVDLRAVFSDAGEAALEETALAQPALFALAYGLIQLWESLGVRPAAVIGHSVGEYAAAFAAGALGLEAALRLVAARGRAMQDTPPGAMAAIFAPAQHVQAALAAAGASATVAALNGPEETVIAGDPATLEAALGALQAKGMAVRRLPVQRAFHSPLVAPAVAPFRAVASTVTFQPPRLPIATNVGGAILEGAELMDEAYWCEQILAPVRFADGLSALMERGYRTFLEIGPHPVLCGLGRARGGGTRWLSSLARGRPDRAQLLETAGALFVAGADVRPERFDGAAPRRRATIAGTSFCRERFWPDLSRSTLARPAVAEGGAQPGPPPAQAIATGAPGPPAPPPVRDGPPPGGPGVGGAELERYLAQLIAAELGLPSPPDVDLTPLQLGLDSLMAVRIVHYLERDLGVAIGLSELFRERTISDLAGRLRQMLGSPVSPEEAAALLQRVDTMDDAEVELLLRRFLAEPMGGMQEAHT